MMESQPVDKFTRPLVVCGLALICCTLWGSAFPSIKIGYALLSIAGEDTMSQMLFAGYRFTLAGIMVICIGSFMKKRMMVPGRGSWSLVMKPVSYTHLTLPTNDSV